jgi:hypothetical protein
MDFSGLNGLIPLNKHEILKRISQEEIFLIVFKTVDINQYYTNPIRQDNKAGCQFNWYNGKLWFCDFADTKTTRDCFEMIKDYYNLNFYQTLEYIDQYFQLGLSEGNPVEAIHKIKQSDNKSSKAKNYITYQSKSFDKYHKQYWSNYRITKDQLISDNISAVIWFKFWSNKRQDWVIVRPFATDVTFSINQWDDAIKICRAKHTGIGKWITNCTKNHIGGLKQLAFTSKRLVITKSYKDWRVLTNQGLDCIWFQNEGMFPDKDKLDSICCTFNEIVIWFDNDNAGINAAKKLENLIKSFHNNVTNISLPIKCLEKQIKDPSDCISKDYIYFKQFLKNKLQWKE